MKIFARKFLSLLLCFALCMNLSITAFAANESNSNGVTFSLSLSEDTLEKSDAPQSVTLTIGMSKAANVIDMEYVLDCDDALVVGTPTTPGNTGISAWNDTDKKMGWMNLTEVNTDVLGTIEITVPANTAGTFTITVRDIWLSDNEDYWETTASASTILTITEPEPPHEHSYTSVVTDPTCTAGGYTTYTCECGDSYIGDETEAAGHNYISTTTDATCTADGKTVYTCSVCGDSYSETITSPGHNYESVVTAPTCTAGGYTTYTCSVCGDSYVGDEVASSGHSYDAVVTAPTCTAEG